jgi:hypothetical protein
MNVAAAPVAGSVAGLEELDDLREAFRLGQRQLALASALAVGVALDFGDLDLPAAGVSAEEQAQLRVAAPLFFASSLESARLLPALEMLSAVWSSGALPIDIGPVGPQLVRFARERESRLTPEERTALFGRLFGTAGGPDYAGGAGGRNVAFEPALTALAGAIVDAFEWSQGNILPAANAVRIRAASQRVADSLSGRMGGIASFAAAELLEQLRFAIAVFRMRAVQQAVGGNSLWSAVRSVAQRYLNEPVDVARHVARARSGQALLAWLADATALHSLAAPAIDDALAGHAVEWLSVSPLR